MIEYTIAIILITLFLLAIVRIKGTPKAKKAPLTGTELKHSWMDKNR